ncbi:sulfatase-like hydrolase/transferase [Aeoliella sp. SH292]|uniref:sulfatase-like hydrolase/transferase n=1 Tax=Aeoliella sp. SH292 TaxID=3454464 RepID=UPI003F9A0BB1
MYFKWFTIGVVLILPVGLQAELMAKQNVVIILADDVGREVLGCYGGTSYKTPRIDELAASGTRFEQCYVMPMCHPTRIALLTGQYPFRLGHPEWMTFPKAAEAHTIAHTFQRAGYRTCVSGKWQLALISEDRDHPHRLGFDEYCVTGWHEGPWFYNPLIWENGEVRSDTAHRYGPDVECDYVVDFIGRQGSEPFFIYYSMTLCHAETNDLEKPAPYGPNGRYDTYAEMVPKMDHCVGRVLDALEGQGLRDNTLVLFLGDNGTAKVNLIRAEGQRFVYEDVYSEMGGRKIAGGKGTLTDWGTRVPLIASQPGAIESGQVSDDLVSIVDFMPSAAALLGVELPREVRLDGQTIPAIDGQGSPREFVFCEHHLGGSFVRNQRWKLYDDGRLYDMEHDPDESHALEFANQSDEVAKTRHRLQEHLVRLGYTAPRK